MRHSIHLQAVRRSPSLLRASDDLVVRQHDADAAQTRIGPPEFGCRPAPCTAAADPGVFPEPDACGFDRGESIESIEDKGFCGQGRLEATARAVAWTCAVNDMRGWTPKQRIHRDVLALARRYPGSA